MGVPKPVDRHAIMIEDTLTRVGALGVPDRQVQRETGVPEGFLRKSRNGKNRNPNALESWAKLRRWLVARGALKEDEPAEVTPPASSPTTVPTAEDVPQDLAGMFLAVKSTDELLTVDREIAARTARGEIDARLSEVLQGWSRELRQVLEVQEAHAAREELVNLVPMSADQAEEFWRAQEASGVRPLAPGEAARPPEKK